MLAVRGMEDRVRARDWAEVVEDKTLVDNSYSSSESDDSGPEEQICVLHSHNL